MKKTVENKRANIAQIQKYLKGELDARAMHKLEREAQDDPFLMDALEGYAPAGNQQGNIDALKQRLDARTAPKMRRLIPWTAISIAASVIGFAMVVGLLYKNNNSPQTEKVAMNQPEKSKQADKAPVLTDTNTVPQIAEAKPKYEVPAKASGNKAPVLMGRVSSAPPASVAEVVSDNNMLSKSPPDSSRVEDMVIGYMADKKANKDTVLGGEYVAINKNASSLSILKSKAEGVRAPDQPKRTDNAYALRNTNLPTNLTQGIALNPANRASAPAVSTKPPGTANDAQNNASSYTQPITKKDEAEAAVTYNYNTQAMKVKNDDSLKRSLRESSGSLSEVVIVQTDTKAHPQAGWENYKKYLKTNAISPDGKEGDVEVQLTVNPIGSITNIKVTKSLSQQADNKAISLIKNGPAWVSSANGKAKVVKVKVSFRK